MCGRVCEPFPQIWSVYSNLGKGATLLRWFCNTVFGSCNKSRLIHLKILLCTPALLFLMKTQIVPWRKWPGSNYERFGCKLLSESESLYLTKKKHIFIPDAVNEGKWVSVHASLSVRIVYYNNCLFVTWYFTDMYLYPVSLSCCYRLFSAFSSEEIEHFLLSCPSVISDVYLTFQMYT